MRLLRVQYEHSVLKGKLGESYRYDMQNNVSHPSNKEAHVLVPGTCERYLI